MIICMAVASIVFIIFVFLFITASDNMVDAILVCLMETEKEANKELQSEIDLLIKKIKQQEDFDNKENIKKGKRLKKKLEESQKRYKKLENRKIGILDIIPITGYRLIQLLGWDATNETVKKLNRKCVQFKEKKEAVNYTYYLLGALFGYLILGICLCFLGLGLSLAMGLEERSDNVNTIIHKRAEEIENQFPQVVSKMALLTVAGMEVNQAWKLACSNDKGILYSEMRRVLIDLDNNVSPVEAYSKFITRCNNNYTTKLGTAIIQNVSKGNAEIVKLFRTLNDESWLEHKHNARRKGEAIQSKLLIPTLLMFLGIIILVIVPVMSGFGF